MSTFTIQTPCGAVTGEETDGARFYRAIPYAEAERFEGPVMTEHWDSTLDATQIESDCWQLCSYHDGPQEPGDFYYYEFLTKRDYHYAESPLQLSIIAPADAGGLPVLAFIHGGGFEVGKINELPYGTSTEYAKRGVVLVSIGYRLNIFGLYNGRNYCLEDQLCAVKWLRKNIAAYGGDPDRITLMGQSAGAMSITDLCLTDALKGDIVGAVLMSGGGLIPRLTGPRRAAQTAKFWQRVRDRAGAKTEADMKTLPAEDLWEAWFYVSRHGASVHNQQTGIDDTIVPDVPQKLRKKDTSLDVPMLLGVASQDFLPPVVYGMALRLGLQNARMGRKPVYGYFFDRPLPGNRFRAFHGSDLWYMFGNMDKSWRPFTAEDEALSQKMIDCVANFVRTGDPNGPGLPDWPALSRKQTGFRLFDGHSNGLISPARCRAKLWKTVFFDKGPM